MDIDELRHALDRVADSDGIDLGGARDDIEVRTRRIRGRRRLLVSSLAASGVVVIALTLVMTLGGDEHRSVRVTPATGVPVNPPVVTTTASTTTGSGPSPETRLSTDSRLEFAGLGPIRWGMTIPEAEAAAGTAFVPHAGECDDFGDFPALNAARSGGVGLLFTRDLEIISLSVANPEIRTASGIHVGSTEADVRAAYPRAVATTNVYGVPLLTISDAEGHTIIFWIHDGVVTWMTAGASPDAAAASSKCD